MPKGGGFMLKSGLCGGTVKAWNVIWNWQVGGQGKPSLVGAVEWLLVQSRGENLEVPSRRLNLKTGRVVVSGRDQG